ncbi:AAA family ATPase [Algicola sagamiensis]|uniref:AAA family ATPase n=1 Tax=Algicola sagamiensis TaxID=163869 RepID=UPI000377DB6B|nr:AAA family ATPase [Algicola sagamiensis]
MIIPFCDQEIERSIEEKKEPILNGLYRGNVGFLIAPPDLGKSFLCLSIAYEVSLPCHGLVGVGVSGSAPLKTLIWPIEDTVTGVLSRVQSHMNSFPIGVKQKLKENVSFYNSHEPICSSDENQFSSEVGRAETSLKKLVEAGKGYDLIIIDTLREATGSADETKHDHIINVSLNHLAQEANAAVLVVHHPTKEISRGKEEPSSVSGSGLSSTLSKSKLHLYMKKVADKQKKDSLQLLFTKANYLPPNKKASIELKWSNNSILFSDEHALSSILEGELCSLSEKNVIQKPRQPKKRTLTEKAMIPRDESLLSEESISKANQSFGPFGESMSEQLKSEVLRKKGN